MAENEPGTMDKAKGMAKQAVGAVTGNERMKSEGSIEREGYDAEGHQKYYRTVIRESMERSGLS